MWFLGVIFSDTGIIKHDISLFIADKNKQVFVKLANFLLRNQFAPIVIKLKVVKACVNASLTYGCEAWSSSPLNSIEVMQRKALKMVLKIYNNTPSEIVYLESGCMPLKPLIYKRQLNFFRKIKNDAAVNPTSPISRLVKEIIAKNLPYIRHYIKIDQKFENAFDCFRFHTNNERSTLVSKVTTIGVDDIDSSLGSYLRINPTLQSPSMYHCINCIESDRYILTRSRTGSHNLRIQKGRTTNEKRDERTCMCNYGVQTIDHVLFHCELTKHITALSEIQNSDIKRFFENDNYAYTACLLESIENVLDVKH